MLLISNYEGTWNYYWNFGIDSPFYEATVVKDSTLPTFTSEFPFIPFLQTCVKEPLSINYYKMEEQLSKDYYELKNKKREIIILSNDIKSEIELSELTLKLMQSISEYSRATLTVSQEDINSLILNDFVTLNDLAANY